MDLVHSYGDSSLRIWLTVWLNEMLSPIEASGLLSRNPSIDEVYLGTMSNVAKERVIINGRKRKGYLSLQRAAHSSSTRMSDAPSQICLNLETQVDRYESQEPYLSFIKASSVLTSIGTCQTMSRSTNLLMYVDILSSQSCAAMESPFNMRSYQVGNFTSHSCSGALQGAQGPYNSASYRSRPEAMLHIRYNTVECRFESLAHL